MLKSNNIIIYKNNKNGTIINKYYLSLYPDFTIPLDVRCFSAYNKNYEV